MPRRFALASVILLIACHPDGDRAPYLQRVTPTTATVVWRQEAQQRIDFGGLTPGTRYSYVACGIGGELTSAPPVGAKTHVRAWVLGDSGTGSAAQTAVRDAMRAFVGSERFDLMLHLGDIAYEAGTSPQLTEKFFEPYADTLAVTPVWPALGNHEAKSSDVASASGPWFDAFVLPVAGEAGGVASGTEAYYAFDFANVHFVVLDSVASSTAPGSAQLGWLAADLTATRQDWIVAYWHYPPYSKGSHDSDSDRDLAAMREHVLPVLEGAGVDLVLSGHSHGYERSFLVDGAYDTPTTAGAHIVDHRDGDPVGAGPYHKRSGRHAHDGTVYVVAGHGGRPCNGLGGHPLMARTEMANGSLLLEIEDQRLSLTNVRADGVVSDRVAIVKDLRAP